MALNQYRGTSASVAAWPPEGWLVAGGIAAAACVAAAAVADPALWLFAAVACVVAGAAFYEPRLIGPIIALALPLEITKLAFPFLETRGELGGGLEPTSIVGGEAGTSRLIVFESSSSDLTATPFRAAWTRARRRWRS